MTGAAVAPTPGPEQQGTGSPAVAMVVRNPVSHDARVMRAAHALTEAGYLVTLVGLARFDLPETEERDGVRIVRVSPSGSALRIVDGILAVSAKILRRTRLRHKWVVRRARRVVARLRRQWWLLGERGTARGTVAAWASSLKAPKAAVVATALLPFALARALSKRGPVAEPELDFPPVRPGLVVKAVAWVDLRVRRRLAGSRKAAFAWGFQREAARVMAATAPAVYHCHDIHTIWTGMLASRVHAAPFIYDAHEIYAHQNGVRRTLRRRALVWFVERTALRKGAASITVNDSLADWYAETYRAPRPVVVRNIPRLVASGDADVEIPSPFHLPGTKILYLGGIAAGRGIESCIRALTHLPETQLILMGPVHRWTPVETFMAVADEVGVRDRVHLVPAVPHEQVTRIASHATVGLSLGFNVCLSYYLSLPNKLFECLHAGLPIVTSNFPEMERIVKDWDVGASCDPEDPEAIAGAVRAIVDDPATLERMRANVLVAAEHFRWEHEQERLLDLYARIVGERAPTPSAQPAQGSRPGGVP